MAIEFASLPGEFATVGKLASRRKTMAGNLLRQEKK
jgi:hypothetical protein